MAVETLTTPRSSLPNVYDDVTVREVELAARFENDWSALRDIMRVIRFIRKAPGTTLKSYVVSVELEEPQATPGAVIPYSKTTFEQKAYEEITLELYNNGATLQEIITYGAELSLDQADEQFMNELQLKILKKFYDFLHTADDLSDTASTWKAALAKAKGLVIDKFNKMRKTVTEVVGYANVLDFYDYLGSVDITTQTLQGMTYLKGFMGYSTLILLSDPDIPRGTVYAVPVENIVGYYVDPADRDVTKAGFKYSTAGGETNLIGIHVEPNYDTGVSAVHAILGITLWAEYLDGIAKVTTPVTDDTDDTDDTSSTT